MIQHPYRTFRTTVARREVLGPHFTRITFAGDDLEHFGTDGLDQRIKLIIPFDDGSVTDVGQADEAQGMMDWYRRWRELPDEKRNPIRTYTVRAVRPEAREIDVDFVLHGSGPTAGPASRWAEAAAPGESVVVIDEGLGFNPENGVEKVLLVADETGAPAVAGICASVPPSATGLAIIEAPSADDILPFDAPAGIEVRWLVRDASAKPGSLALAALEELAAPASDTHAFIVGEQSLPTAARRHLVAQGLGKDRISFVGYWRVGAASPAPKSEQARPAAEGAH